MWSRKRKGRTMATGFFVDWDGNTRRVDELGEGMECQVVDRGHTGVDVLDPQGFVIHEATFFQTLEAVAAAGVVVNLV
jgi:hypothetical protein